MYRQSSALDSLSPSIFYFSFSLPILIFVVFDVINGGAFVFVRRSHGSSKWFRHSVDEYAKPAGCSDMGSFTCAFYLSLSFPLFCLAVQIRHASYFLLLPSPDKMMSFTRRTAPMMMTAAARRGQATSAATATAEALTLQLRADAAAMAAAGRMDAAAWVRTFQAPGAAVRFQAPPTVYPVPDFQIAHVPAQSALVRALPFAITGFFWLSFHTVGCVYADAAMPWLASM
jgi:hypothetical protein